MHWCQVREKSLCWVSLRPAEKGAWTLPAGPQPRQGTSLRPATWGAEALPSWPQPNSGERSARRRKPATKLECLARLQGHVAFHRLGHGKCKGRVCMCMGEISALIPLAILPSIGSAAANAMRCAPPSQPPRTPPPPQPPCRRRRHRVGGGALIPLAMLPSIGSILDSMVPHGPAAILLFLISLILSCGHLIESFDAVIFIGVLYQLFWFSCVFLTRGNLVEEPRVRLSAFSPRWLRLRKTKYNNLRWKMPKKLSDGNFPWQKGPGTTRSPPPAASSISELDQRLVAISLASQERASAAASAKESFLRAGKDKLSALQEDTVTQLSERIGKRYPSTLLFMP